MRLQRTLGLLAAGLTTLGLGACGGGGGSGSSGTDGTMSVAITDAASDEIESFVVEVQSLVLVRPTGATVAALADTIRVDLADLSDVSRLLSRNNVPAGFYSGIEITFDFTNAACVLVGETTPATILDVDGNAVTGTLVLPMDFASVLSVPVNRHKLLELDFDLDQSLEVDAGLNTVRFEPALHLKVDPSTPKPTAVFGTIASVDLADSSFVVDVRAFGDEIVTSVICDVGGATLYQVDGVPASGSTGLTALSTLAADTWVQAYGTIDANSERMVIVYVEAGLGTFNGGSAIIEGYVVGRTGGAGADPTLIVQGRSQNASHTVFQYDTTFQISGDFLATQVVKWGSADGFSTDDINVGQRVRAFGTLAGTVMGSTDVVRLQPTLVFGHSVGTPSGTTATIDITRVGPLLVGAFQWAQSGTNPPDPAALIAEVGDLAQDLGLVNGSAMIARGFFSPVDDAGEDFTALALINADEAPSLLFVRDRLLTGFTLDLTAQLSGLQLVITGAAATGEFAIIDQGFVGATPLPSSPTPTISPAGLVGLYAIRDNDTGELQVYTSFASFSSALGNAIVQGAFVVQLGAFGDYDASLNTLSAGVIGAVID
jgi:hypothetical protein